MSCIPSRTQPVNEWTQASSIKSTSKLWQFTKRSFTHSINSTQSIFMDPSSAPPYYHRYSSDPRSRAKSSSRLARVDENGRGNAEPLRISLDLVRSATTLKPPPPSQSPSALSLLRSPNGATNNNSSSYCLPIRELLLLSPSPVRRSKPRFDSAPAAEEFPEPAAGLRRRCKSRGVLGSPRNSRRSRRRSEVEIREEKDVVGLGDEVGKQRKRRHSGRSKKERLSLVPFLPPPASSPSMATSSFVAILAFIFFFFINFWLHVISWIRIFD